MTYGGSRTDASRSLSGDATSSDQVPLVVVPAPQEPPELSIIIPCLNESRSLVEMSERIELALHGKRSYEILFVDDGSTDDSWETISKIRLGNARVRGIRLRKNFGKAMALSAGFQRARGAILLTMDADLQDDPSDIPTLISKLEQGEDVVVGWRVARLDSVTQRILSRLFNSTVRRATGGTLHDMNCGFKAYRREVIKNVPVYGDLFRFIPAFAAWEGFRVAEVPVRHKSRRYGSSHYGFERILRAFLDLLSVTFLTRYRRRPMHLFGLAGLILMTIGVVTETYLSVLHFRGHKIGDRPLLLLGAVQILAGLQLLSTGFIGEFLTYRNQKRIDAADLPIREELT